MKSTSALLAMLAAIFVVAGCGHSSPTSNSTTDPAAQYAGQQGVENSTAALPDEFESTTYEDGAAAKADISAFGVTVGGSVEAAIDPAAWFRLIRRHDRKFVVEFQHPDTNTVEAHVRVVDHLVVRHRRLAANEEALVLGVENSDVDVVAGERADRVLGLP